MRSKTWPFVLLSLILGLLPAASHAGSSDCHKSGLPLISFVQFPSLNLATQPPSPLTVKGKLSLPAKHQQKRGCDAPKGKVPAVLILHGSAGVDARGDFYAEALNAAGIAALQIDMWEARRVTGIVNRPQVPILTYPDAFAALAFLSAHPAIEASHIGVLGFSWGGVVSLAAAEQLYAGTFGGGLRFAAHVANYPVCWGANNPLITPGTTPAAIGTQLLNLTGAPVLIQIGTEDDYDNGSGPCHALADAVNPNNNNVVKVVDYPGAYHAWDRLMIPVTALDPFANEGSYFTSGGTDVPTVEIVPDVAQAHASRERVVRFFRRTL